MKDSDDVADCDRGLHGPLVEGLPQLGEHSVEVDEFCTRCKRRIATMSWTRAAWDREQQKRAQT